MTKEYDNEMRGVLFKNKDREKDSQPQAKGSCQIEGVEYWVSAWTNTDRNGNKYQALSFQRKDAVDKKGMEQARQAAEETFTDDDVPF
jgi:hypothetical protein